jgi:hypothetical protein
MAWDESSATVLGDGASYIASRSLYISLFLCTLLAYVALVQMGFFNSRNRFPLKDKVIQSLYKLVPRSRPPLLTIDKRLQSLPGALKA